MNVKTGTFPDGCEEEIQKNDISAVMTHAHMQHMT